MPDDARSAAQNAPVDQVANEKDKRPVWEFDVKEDDARWLLSHRVTKITSHWQFTGVDTSKDWITLHPEKGEPHNFPSSFFHEGRNGFRFDPDGHRLIRPCSYRGEQIRKRIEEIDKWEKKNQRDRSEYERLKKKFGAGL